MDQVAFEEGWRGPVADPVLTPGLPNSGMLPAGHLLADHPLAGQFQGRAQPVSLAGYAGNLTLHLHAVLNPDKRTRPTTGSTGPDPRPDYCPEVTRVANCYQAQVGGTQCMVGNCYLTL